MDPSIGFCEYSLINKCAYDRFDLGVANNGENGKTEKWEMEDLKLAVATQFPVREIIKKSCENCTRLATLDRKTHCKLTQKLQCKRVTLRALERVVSVLCPFLQLD